LLVYSVKNLSEQDMNRGCVWNQLKFDMI